MVVVNDKKEKYQYRVSFQLIKNLKNGIQCGNDSVTLYAHNKSAAIEEARSIIYKRHYHKGYCKYKLVEIKEVGF